MIFFGARQAELRKKLKREIIILTMLRHKKRAEKKGGENKTARKTIKRHYTTGRTSIKLKIEIIIRTRYAQMSQVTKKMKI